MVRSFPGGMGYPSIFQCVKTKENSASELGKILILYAIRGAGMKPAGTGDVW
jgi:hypothetical protein